MSEAITSRIHNHLDEPHHVLYNLNSEGKDTFNLHICILK